jgi:hypothetical protein
MNTEASSPGFVFTAPRFSVMAASIRRFPLATLAAIFFASCWILMIHEILGREPDDYGRLTYGGFAGFFLLLGLGLVFEARGWSRLLQLLTALFSVGALAGWLALAGPELGLPHVLLGCALVGFCIIAPALGGAGNDALWRFNQQSFFGFGIAGIAVGLSQLGIAAISFSVAELFKISGSEKIFFDLSVVVLALFWPLYSITFMPRLPLSEARMPQVPGPLAFVLSYVALPILLLYGVVIASYGLRLLGIGATPKSSVSWMIIGFATAGIALRFLLHPLRAQGNVLVRLFCRYFYLLLLPYLVLLFWALSIRIGAYGVTEMRYLALLGGLWAAGLSVHALISRHDFKLGTAPAALVVLLVLAGLGPWSAESIGYSSQKGRLEQTLSALGLLKDGHLAESANLATTSWQTRRDLSSLLDYFRDRRDNRMPHYLREVEKIELGTGAGWWAEALMRRWNMAYINSWQRRDENGSAIRSITYSAPSLFTNQREPVRVSGYDWLVPFYLYGPSTSPASGSGAGPVKTEISGSKLMFTVGTETVSLDVLALLPAPLEQQGSSINGQQLISELNAGKTKLRVVIESVTVSLPEQRDASEAATSPVWEIRTASGFVFVSLPH